MRPAPVTGAFDLHDDGMVKKPFQEGRRNDGITNEFMMPSSSIVYCVGRARSVCRSFRPSVRSAMVVLSPAAYLQSGRESGI